jgi:hypothetical protein
MVSFENNSTLLLSPEDGTIKSTIYPPPTPTTITQVVFCMALNRVFLLLESGTLCIYKVHNRETATLDRLQFAKQIRDYEGKKLAHAITTMTIVSIVPPEFDNEVVGDLRKFILPLETAGAKDSSESEDEGYQAALIADIAKQAGVEHLTAELESEYKKNLSMRRNDLYLACGLETGSIIFLSVRSLDQLYARFSVHRHAITELKEMQAKKTMLSICSEHKLMLWGFKDGKYKLFR